MIIFLNKSVNFNYFECFGNSYWINGSWNLYALVFNSRNANSYFQKQVCVLLEREREGERLQILL